MLKAEKAIFPYHRKLGKYCYNENMENVIIQRDPIVTDALAHLRDKATDTKRFRKYADSISYQLLGAAVSENDLEEKEIETPLTKTTTQVFRQNFVFITILRAGLAMLPAVFKIFPSIPVGFVGLKRDEKTAIAHEYYANVPAINSETIVLLADPMLATGGSMISAIRKINLYNPKEIRLISIVCAPEGIAAVHNEFPNIKIVTAAVDSQLNDKKYIVPGLGDFGDRYFCTE